MLIASLLTWNDYREKRLTFLRLSIVSFEPGILQVFYDIGQGLQEKDSKTSLIASPGMPQVLTIPLSTYPISHLRLDPINRPGRLIVKNGSIVDSNGNLIRELSFNTFKPIHDIAQFENTEQGFLISTTNNATDPMIDIEVKYPIICPGATRWNLAVYFTMILALCLPAIFSLLAVLLWRTGCGIWSNIFKTVKWFFDSSRSYSSVARLSLFTLIVILTIARGPYLLTQPRFWAEEGSIWFQHALHSSVIQNIFFIYVESSYLQLSTNLGATIAALTAKAIGLLYAPAATTYFSLGLQLLPVAILVFGKSHLFNRAWKILVGSLIILFAPATVGEIWLNTINSMSWLGLTALILLFENTLEWSFSKRALMRMVCVFAGFSGLYAAVLFPLFFVAHFVYKEREKLTHAFLLGACFVAQLGIVLLFRQQGVAGGANSTRFSQLTFDSMIVNIFFFHIAVALLGQNGASKLFKFFGLTDSLQRSLATPRHGEVILAAWFCLLLLTIFTYFLWDKIVFSQRSLLICAFFTFSVLTGVASINGIPAGRYAFLPGLTLLFLLLDNINSSRTELMRCIFVFLLAGTLLAGMKNYRHNLLIYGTTPLWADEVAVWKSDRNHRLRVWPAPWTETIKWNP